MTAEYRIRENPRSRHMRLKVLDDASLEVVAPPGSCRRQIREFVRNHTPWIRRTRARILAAGRGHDPLLDGPLPARLELTALGRVVQVNYTADARGPDPSASTSASAGSVDSLSRDHLTMSLYEPDPAVVRMRLLEYLKQTARAELNPRLQAIAADHELSFGRVTWRNQRSRWGSCSANGNLSLNVKLLFVVPELARYVLAHELAHRIHPNHSPAFWEQVARMEPAYRRLRAELKKTWQVLPAWIRA